MESISFIRVIKTGFVNFWRNLWLSAAATMVMTITLVIFALMFLMFAVTNYSISTFRNTVDVSAYLKVGLAQAQIDKIKAELQRDSRIREIAYTSQQRAFDQFKQRHSGDPLITSSLNELIENPLPATFNIKAYNLDDYPAISQKLQGPDYKGFITKVNFEDNRVIIDRLSKILRYVITFGAGLLAVFSVIAILVIFNTIALTIYNRKEEVEIMRLVGATNWYIRGPFLTESFLYALGSTVLTGLLAVPVFTGVLPKIAIFVNPQLTVFHQNLFNFWYLLALLFAVSVLLAFISTMLAIRKYLKI
jgi:cell division transport system permease protein